MTKRIPAVWISIVCVALGGWTAVRAGGPAFSAPVVPQAPSPYFRALLNQYSVTCHNQRLNTARLSLDTTDLANAPAHAEICDKVNREFRSGTMPPAGQPLPDAFAYDSLASFL